MGDLKARIKARFLRRNSASPSLAPSRHSDSRSSRQDQQHASQAGSRGSSSKPHSVNTTHAASSINTSGEGDDINPRGSSSGDNHGDDSKAHLHPTSSNGDGSLSIAAANNDASKSTISTAATSPGPLTPSTNANTCTKDSATDDASSPSPQQTDNIVNESSDTDGPVSMSGTGANDGGSGDLGVERGLGCAETKTLANSNNNANDKSSRTSTASTLGSDLQNSSVTAPDIITHLPSINEDPTALLTSPAIAASSSQTTGPSLAPPPSISLNSPNSPNSPVPLPAATPGAANLDDYDEQSDVLSPDIGTPTPLGVPASLRTFPTATRPAVPRRQSILPNRQTTLIRALLNSGQAQDLGLADPDQYSLISPNMVTRKIWVKRPGASATLVTINEEDLVDDVRDMILRKYSNSLGRQFDAPDLTLRICPKEQNPRLLQPDEPMGRTLDAYFPGGQTVDDAILIDVPTRRTPKASPNPRYYDDRPHESGTDYFPPYPPANSHHTVPATAIVNGAHGINFPPSMTIIGSNGQLPPLPSPGGRSRLGGTRPKMQRMHTASPVSTNGHVTHSQHAAITSTSGIGTLQYSIRPVRSRTHSGASSEQTSLSTHAHQAPAAPPMATPPIPESVDSPPRVSSPRPPNRPKKTKKVIEHPSLPPGMLNGGVPPINVLIVEDNIINLKLLEAFVKRLKVRWQTAMNGREAVNKWRAGGFHLVLMDIQLPVMNGLEATREIRRIEKVNSIGVFSSGAISAPEQVSSEPEEGDKLSNTEMFKSPVIIVALTASSLQSDRHEALAAGCNDFLTKPVNFVWLERKVMEWGCMQALIDFDGWRKWKDFSQKAAEDETVKKAAATKAKTSKKNRLSMTTAQVELGA